MDTRCVRLAEESFKEQKSLGGREFYSLLNAVDNSSKNSDDRLKISLPRTLGLRLVVISSAAGVASPPQAAGCAAVTMVCCDRAALHNNTAAHRHRHRPICDHTRLLRSTQKKQ
ncbi:hypothetical protein AND_001807 [Anopheles darlingi]|uniref:Uncharacterized protein n=2 Tax=Anopheles darlingi TaxID=43151 RepID=W5JTZ6_ANODA|nr:hypothetical protein AND_001807 [Anopheles darlingi]